MTKVAFFGTSDRSINILEQLNTNFDLKLCITKTDSLVGRKQTIKPSKVKSWALENNIQVYEVNSFKKQEEEITNLIKSKEIEIGIVADFKFMITGKVISILDNKLINIHFSLLPKYRGASPVQHSILNGDNSTGITYLLTTIKMDEGDILHQIPFNIKEAHNSESVYQEMFSIAAGQLPKVIQDFLVNKIIPIQQDENLASYSYSKTVPKSTQICKEDAFIEVFDDISKVDRYVRAFYPWPIAWTKLGILEKARILPQDIRLKSHINKNLSLKIYSGKIAKDTKGLAFKYAPEIIQIEGKNKMKWDDFLNGYCEKVGN